MDKKITGQILDAIPSPLLRWLTDGRPRECTELTPYTSSKFTSRSQLSHLVYKNAIFGQQGQNIVMCSSVSQPYELTCIPICLDFFYVFLPVCIEDHWPRIRIQNTLNWP